jgi:hypothetical protein
MPHDVGVGETPGTDATVMGVLGIDVPGLTGMLDADAVVDGTADDATVVEVDAGTAVLLAAAAEVDVELADTVVGTAVDDAAGVVVDATGVVVDDAATVVAVVDDAATVVDEPATVVGVTVVGGTVEVVGTVEPGGYG